MSDTFVVGRYNRELKTITSLMLVLPLEEDLRQCYDEGFTIYVANKAYKLEHREIIQKELVQYQMTLLKT